jgi:hypothetical protein
VLLACPLVLRPGSRQRGGVDYAGALAITGALVLAVYALVTGHAAGWTSTQTLGLLTVAGVLLAAFVAIQAARRAPLVPLSIFAAPNLSAGNLVMALLGGAWIPGWYFLNLYLQQVLGYSALASGLALLPMTVAIMALMVGLTARLVGRFGFKPNLVAGLVLLAASMLLFARVPVEGSFLVDVLPASLVGALGMSLAYIPATIAGMPGAKPEQTGLASGLINTTYQVGSALGLAAMTAVAYSGTEVATFLSGDAQLMSGFRLAFVGAAAVAGVAALVAFVGVRTPCAAAAQPVAEEVEQLRAA